MSQCSLRGSTKRPRALLVLLVVLSCRDGFSAAFLQPLESRRPPRPRRNIARHAKLAAVSSEADDRGTENAGLAPDAKAGVSKTEMLKFALPALGIYIAGPLMGNVDNAFVGRFSGTAALAALSPGSVLANNLWFLFASILNSATTGVIARAWAGGSGDDPGGRVRKTLASTLSSAWVVGFGLSAFYLFASPWAIRAMGTPSLIAGQASLYAQIVGVTSCASLVQGVCLSAILATRDAVTPLQVILSAQVVNLIGDFLLCCWPLRMGIAGAATATAISTMISFFLMLGALRRKKLLPKFRLPLQSDIKLVLEYAGPLFVITAARILGFSAMAFTASSLGTAQLAAYQVIISVFVVFVFVGGPLSQNAQTLLPSLIDAGDTKGLRRTFRNIVVIASTVSAITSVLYFAAIRFGSAAFTADAGVLGEVTKACLSSVLPAASLMVMSSVDGAMTAAKDFRFIVVYQCLAVAVQLFLLSEIRSRGLGLSSIFLTFTVRLWICAVGAGICIFGGLGRLGGAMGLRRRRQV